MVLIIELDVWKWGDFLNGFKTESTRKLSTVNKPHSQISHTPSLATQIWEKKFFMKKIKRDPKSSLGSLLSSSKVNLPTMNSPEYP